jgi:rubrerythrin
MLIERDAIEAEEAADVVDVPPPREYRCGCCGYGAVLRSTRPSCPMCGGTEWEAPARGAGLRPLAD